MGLEGEVVFVFSELTLTFPPGVVEAIAARWECEIPSHE